MAKTENQQALQITGIIIIAFLFLGPFLRGCDNNPSIQEQKEDFQHRVRMKGYEESEWDF